MLETLRSLIGIAPAGLEFMEYFAMFALVILGFGLLFTLVLKILGIFKKGE